MGNESFYVNLEIKEIIQESNSLNVIFYDNNNLTIEYSLFSFFEGCQKIYNFIKLHIENINDVESRKLNLFNYIDEFDVFFINMYNIWKDRLQIFYEQYGLIVLKSGDEFYKKIRKIKKIVDR